ncbi:tetratricopeptide repeat protein [Panacagrimonas perspica]|uniref:Tetratricopeptide repeat protein n=1 Tax=Panacagrimonas perspica TaxID=381431 RepID=A0A4R7NU32_9GAMM|nr:tetratricopeptide repeat protein [Panacagrimonas perspica]
MRPRSRRLGLLACGCAALLLTGCVTETRRQLDRTVAAEVPLTETPESRRQVHIDLIRKMLVQEQYYAALAHIQGQVRESGPRDELRLLEAQTRRKLGQDAEAQALYRELLKTKYAADAYHGLGLISAKTDQRTAIWQLQQAVQRRPTDSEMRNDLGYALMLAGRYREALPELATAVELESSTGSVKARNNLILLALVTGDETAVQRLMQQSDVSPEMLARLRKQAQSLRTRSAQSPAPARKN